MAFDPAGQQIDLLQQTVALLTDLDNIGNEARSGESPTYVQFAAPQPVTSNSDSKIFSNFLQNAEGFDYYGKKWFVTRMCNVSGDISGVLALPSWQTSNGTVQNIYMSEDGVSQLTTPTPAFLLGKPHGAGISLPYAVADASVLPTTPGTNILASIGGGDRYSKITVLTNALTKVVTCSYKTYRNSTFKTFTIPLGTGTFSASDLPEGDYYTDIEFSSVSGNSGSFNVNVSGFQWPSLTINVNIKAFLQGAMRGTGTSMGQELRTASLLPTTDPYGKGISVPGINGMSGVVDYVLVQLRADPASNIAFLEKVGLLKTDGTVAGTDGNQFTLTVNGSYYIVLKHRNHLAVCTPNPVGFGGLAVTWDTTTALSTVYLTGGAYPMVHLNTISGFTNDAYALWAGDVNQDGKVYKNASPGDSAAINTYIGGIGTDPVNNVYSVFDANMDSVVHDDVNSYASETGLVSYNVKQHPANTFHADTSTANHSNVAY